ncbi:MAG: MobC family plasmid mobilization relaxosome protein [Acidobacteria bacterium]|nr:MobC family plasmid mobilization relaxosome protein [Acidobacteriota bacterium]
MPDTRPRKTHLVQARVSPEEYSAWTAKASAAGVSSSALLREALTHTGVWTPTADGVEREQAREVERERTREIARIGNNVNQLAKWANRYQSAADAVEVVVHLAAIERALRGLAPSRPAD